MTTPRLNDRKQRLLIVGEDEVGTEERRKTMKRTFPLKTVRVSTAVAIAMRFR